MEISQNCLRVQVILLFGIFSSLVSCQHRESYRVPQPNARILAPRGFRISIPNERGIRLFAFHGALNRELSGDESGDFNYETREKANGEWVYENHRTHLRHGDVLYFWIYVQHDNFGYRLDNQRYVYPDNFDLTYTLQNNGNHQHHGNYPNQHYGNQQGQDNHEDQYNSGSHHNQHHGNHQGQEYQENQYGGGNHQSNGNAHNGGNSQIHGTYHTHGNNQNYGNHQNHHGANALSGFITEKIPPTPQLQTLFNELLSNFAPPRTTTRPVSPIDQFAYPNVPTTTTTTTEIPITVNRVDEYDIYTITNQNPQQTFTNPNQNPQQTYTNTNQNPQQTFTNANQNPQQTDTNTNENPQQTFTNANQNPQQTYTNTNQNPQQTSFPQPSTNYDGTGNQYGNNYNPYGPNTGYNTNDRDNHSADRENQFTNQQTTRQTTRRPVRTTSSTTRRSPTASSNNDRWPASEQHCSASVSFANGKRIKCKNSLIFEENFSESIDERWSADVRMPLETEDAEFVVYQNYSSVWNVTRGYLNIFPTLIQETPESGISQHQIRNGRINIDQKECTPLSDPDQECERHAGLQRILPPVVSAKLRTKKSFSFKYGRVEIRAKLPKGDWLYPQLLLEPTHNVYGGGSELPFLNGLIRIAFIHGNEHLEKEDGIPLDGKILFGSTIVAPGDQYRETGRKSEHFGQEHFGNQFHVYSIIWTPTSIRFSVDGIDYGTDTGHYKQLTTIKNAAFWEQGGQMAPFDQEFHIAIGVGAAGNADFPDGTLNGRRRKAKPWTNTDPKAELNFFQAANHWHSTWSPQESGLIVDYVKVYSV